MKLSEYRRKLRDEFFRRLDRKTGWGKEQIKEEFREASEAILLDMLYEVEESSDSLERREEDVF